MGSSPFHTEKSRAPYPTPLAGNRVVKPFRRHEGSAGRTCNANARSIKRANGTEIADSNVIARYKYITRLYITMDYAITILIGRRKIQIIQSLSRALKIGKQFLTTDAFHPFLYILLY